MKTSSSIIKTPWLVWLENCKESLISSSPPELIEEKKINKRTVSTEKKNRFFSVINVNYAQMRNENKFPALHKNVGFSTKWKNFHLNLLVCRRFFALNFIYRLFCFHGIKFQLHKSQKNTHLNIVLIFFKLLHAY